MSFLAKLLKFIFINKVTLFVVCFFLSIVLKLTTLISKLKLGQKALIRKHKQNEKVRESVAKGFDKFMRDFNNR